MIASFGRFDKLPLGGGQTAARRLFATLGELDYCVTAIHRHPPTSSSKMIRGLQFIFWSLADPILVTYRLLFKSRRNAITLYMGYMGSVLIPLEWTMAWLTRYLGYKNLMYLAGGGTEKIYEKANHVQRFFERRIAQNYHMVLTEGYDNMAFIRRISSTGTAYLPNFTEDGFAPFQYPLKPTGRWNFIYFGRICENKNVLLSLDVFNQICETYSNAYFTIVGGGPKDYCQLVEAKKQASPYKNKITTVGRLSHEDLKQIMLDQHFYIFPSIEPREGHSNALNEAMSYGLVPIVSDNNFLPSIVGNNRLVTHENTAQSYVDIIVDVIESGDYNRLSHEMFERVKQNFTQVVVEDKLKQIIDSL